MSFLPRYILPRIIDALKVSPVVFLNGPRQAGKSTLVQEIQPAIGTVTEPAIYVTFDRPTQVAAATAAPEQFLTARNAPLIIDEVQLVPELFRTLKVVVDDLRRNSGNVNGRYLLTGSANILALPKLADPLVGRMSVLTIYPFCTSEALSSTEGTGLDRLLELNFTGMHDQGVGIIEAIEKATFPELLYKNRQERSIWFDGYITTLLQRDVRMLAELDKIAALPQLLRLLAIRVGNLINDSDISRDLGLTSVTCRQYRNILKMMFLTFDVQPWYRNLGKRLVKAPKGYLLDTLLLCHMMEWSLEDIYNNKPELFGHLLENYVATELTKQLSFHGAKVQLFHFRTGDGKEVDFILERPDGAVLAVEVKSAEAVGMQDFRGIQTFAELAGASFMGGIVLYGGREAVPFGDRLWAVPLCVLWQ